MQELRHHELWWTGPNFIRLDRNEWPAHSVGADEHPVLENEAALTRLVGIYRAQGRALPERGESPFSHIGSWSAALRAVRTVRRAAQRWGEKCGRYDGVTCGEELTATDIALRAEQRALWPDEFSLLEKGGTLPVRHPWAKLHVTLERGLLRVRGRATEGALPLLSKTSHLALLWVRHVHNHQLQHGGGHRTLISEVQKDVWIVGLAVLARAVSRSCVICKRAQPTPFRQPEAPLPPFRVGAAKGQTVFSHALMDECGPFLTRQGRGRPAVKRWILVLTCGATRAVHLELLPDRTATAIAEALIRFACRHPVPKKIVCDNAPEFEAGASLLRGGGTPGPEDGSRGWREVEWQHYPPYAPNFGGAVEAIVKLTKATLRKVVRDREQTDLDLSHCIRNVEFILNSRPISALSDDPADSSPITPNTFLRDLGQVAGVTAPMKPTEVGGCSARLRAAVEESWTELSKGIRAELQQAHHVVGQSADVQEGDVVVALDVPPLPGQSVSLGRIERLWAGADGVARRADVVVRGKTYQRALKSLAPLLRERCSMDEESSERASESSASKLNNP